MSDVNNDTNDYCTTEYYIDLALCAEKIVYRTNVYRTNYDDRLRTELCNFKTHKITQRDFDKDDVDDDVADARVEFDRKISSKKAIGVLKMIIAQIETHGLPPTKLLLPRNLAELVVKQELKSPEAAYYLFRWLLSKTSTCTGGPKW